MPSSDRIPVRRPGLVLAMSGMLGWDAEAWEGLRIDSVGRVPSQVAGEEWCSGPREHPAEDTGMTAERQVEMRSAVPSSAPRAWTPLFLGVTGRRRISPHETAPGLRFPDVPAVHGLSLGLALSELQRLDGIGIGLLQGAESGVHAQVGLVNTSSGIALLQAGVLNLSEGRAGFAFQCGLVNLGYMRSGGVPVQLGAVSFATRSLLQTGGYGATYRQAGLQFNLVNWAKDEQSGVQLGIWNGTTRQCGLQVGLYNSADRLTGVQVGLLNRARSGGLLPWMPLFNVGRGR